MSTPATSNGDCNAGSIDKIEENARLSDTNYTSPSASTRRTGSSSCSSSSMKVQDFMSYLAKEADIANMTVETNDGRRISATFKHGLPTCTSTPRNESPTSNLDPNPALESSVKIAERLVKGVGSDGRSEELNKINEENDKATMMSPTRDIATTMAMMGAEKTVSTPSTLSTSGFDANPPQEWTINYQNKHVAVTCSIIGTRVVSSLINGSVQKTNGSCTSGAGTTTSLPPKKRAAVKTEEEKSESSWNAMSALVDAATVAQREHEQVPPGVAGVDGSASAKLAATIAMGVNIPTTSFKKKPTKRKPRKIIPEIKEYVEFTQQDVLFGRGGRSNHHPGNKTYRDVVTKQQHHYRGCDKNEKTKVAQGIVDHIQLVVGGRFLELDRGIKRWFLVPNVVARRKVGQALRENNTEEARAAKRAKYQGRLNSKKKSLGTAENVTNGNCIVPMIAVNSSDCVTPVVAVNSTNIHDSFPIGATEVTINSFPIDDAEGSNGVAV